MTWSQKLNYGLIAIAATLVFFLWKEHDHRIAENAVYQLREAEWKAKNDSLVGRIKDLQHETDSLSKHILAEAPTLAAALDRVRRLQAWRLSHSLGATPRPDTGNAGADTGVAGLPHDTTDADSSAALGQATDAVVSRCSEVLVGCGQLALKVQRLNFKVDSLTTSNAEEHDRQAAKVKSVQSAAFRDKLIWGALGILGGYAIGHVH